MLFLDKKAFPEEKYTYKHTTAYTMVRHLLFDQSISVRYTMSRKNHKVIQQIM